MVRWGYGEAPIIPIIPIIATIAPSDALLLAAERREAAVRVICLYC
jgi:hypothetical protein